ncbi:MAG: hypothetical protein A3G49_00770 [Candidatus Sungbacteria bacterium RIFCSPLOWO2_12_FULL_41_11]|uniref:Glycosyltransferase 2-like domain-containing protein n=1 Tax=Candidatus Sungbacteria bacterium RIFCSPLOWO2_12_FULL_41_11 TaxID=1802286 RepID=A0A1G2LPI0_9BACT|nr:MAG: hypothetical protein A3D41_02075 [Candidatus Sungbacteria bacterium RIFCSPHIGHO2_02_FULL_41_12b]OHA12752.1 MAG: hypothetical protein A3G49_00770 [Candidatus Sungbacteria bacterium RIFCSPLOWO2_12_FULL_41_11]
MAHLTSKKISVVVICYRDEGSVRAMYDRLSKVLKDIASDYEIIYVNDASPDHALDILKDLAERDPRLTVVSHSINFGNQNAFTSGMMQSQGDAVVILDGDLQDPPELIPEMVKKWLEGFEVVYGVRVKREAPLYMNFSYKLFYRLFRYFSYVRVPLDAGDFSLMDRRVVDALNQMPERDRFIRGLRAWVGFRQTGVSYFRPERFAGRSTNNIRSNIRWAKKAIFSFSYVPLEFVSYIAFFAVIISFIAIVVYVILYFMGFVSPRGYMTLLVSILFLGSVQLLSLSIIGEYIGRIFEETKRRPQFIVKDIINDHRKK